MSVDKKIIVNTKQGNVWIKWEDLVFEYYWKKSIMGTVEDKEKFEKLKKEYEAK